MSARRGETDLSGILAVDKPTGVTSHDVVNRVRRATGERRIGHAGTLDPMATGLLVVLVGPATRLAPYLTAADKTYDAQIVFGAETDTDDADGRVTITAPVPDDLSDPFFAAGTVAALVGVHEQVPPAFSAIKRGGQTAHHVARRGGTLALEARAIEVSSARLLGVEIEPDLAWDVELTVSKGTYVRALARDLGRALDTAAHLGRLRRTHAGSLDVASGRTLDEIESADDVCALFTDPIRALALPVVEVGEDGAARVAVGAPLDVGAHDADALADRTSVAVVRGGALLAVYARAGELLRPQAVIPGGVRGSLP